MSSMRNAVQRRNHKERAQPLERQKWGILEKHKDYSLRAKDFNEKKKRLKILREKAAERNPDEFSFGMMSSRTEGGRKITDRGNKALSEEVVKLLKTQDVGYIRTMLQQVRKEREKLEQGVILDDQEAAEVFKGKQGKGRKGHTVFVEDQEEQKKFKPDEWFGVAGEDVDRAWNRRRVGGADQKRDAEDEEDGEAESKPKGRVSKKKEEAALQAWKEERAMQKKRERMQELRRARLEAVKERERELRTAEEALELQRAKMSHSIGGVNKNGVKFKIRERKR